jgi:hypothetical protein
MLVTPPYVSAKFTGILSGTFSSGMVGAAALPEAVVAAGERRRSVGVEGHPSAAG